MKTLLKIISLSMLISISLFANVQKIDECKVDLYYANGILIDMDVTQAKHELRWNDMVDDMFISNPEEYKKIANAKISYNRSQGFDDDIYESLEQVMSNEWGWKDFSLFFRNYLETHNIQEAYDTHIPDLTAQVKAYKDSIKLGHGVIVIAHSQGNYYTNEAYEKLDEWMKDYFHMFGVATPANHVAGFPVDDAAAPYVLFHNDFINFIVTALPSNLDDTRHHGFPSSDAHDFYESYMKEETSKKMITDFIIDEIQKHSKTDSQWELDQELNKGTKDYKITLKHRFDTSITGMQDIEVYPFKPSEKLYYVIGEESEDILGYVKARCGGYKIETTWVGQDTATQIAKLSHTDTTLPHEVIMYHCSEMPYLEDQFRDINLYLWRVGSVLSTWSFNGGYTGQSAQRLNEWTNTWDTLWSDNMYSSYDNSVELFNSMSLPEINRQLAEEWNWKNVIGERSMTSSQAYVYCGETYYYNKYTLITPAEVLIWDFDEANPNMHGASLYYGRLTWTVLEKSNVDTGRTPPIPTYKI